MTDRQAKILTHSSTFFVDKARDERARIRDLEQEQERLARFRAAPLRELTAEQQAFGREEGPYTFYGDYD